MQLRPTILAGLLLAAFVTTGFTREFYAYFGTYTGKGSSGIYRSRFDSDTGRLSSPQLAIETTNPCFLAIAPSGKFLLSAADFITDGKTNSGVATFAINPTDGGLAFINGRSCDWRGVCHVSLDATGRWALAASYNSGAVCILPVDETGRLGEISAKVIHHGSSVNTNRQAGPHAHQVIADPANRYVFVPDLGLDKVMSYRLDGSLTSNTPPFAVVAPGSGPRHLEFRPDGRFAYVINELNSTVTVFSYDAERGALKEIQTITTLPASFTNYNTAAEVVVSPSGKYLYASNRGHDSIAVFSIHRTSGKLTYLEHQPTRGKTPRFITLDTTGKFMFALNQNSDSIVTYKVSRWNGKLKAFGPERQLSAPVCLRFLPINP